MGNYDTNENGQWYGHQLTPPAGHQRECRLEAHFSYQKALRPPRHTVSMKNFTFVIFSLNFSLAIWSHIVGQAWSAASLWSSL